MRRLQAAGHPLAFEPQFDIRDESLAWTNLGWDDWVTWEDTPYPFVPMVNQAKWLEPRHMVDVTDRFTRDKINSLQHAFFNGNGYATLENLWGFWYGMTPRDAESVLRITRIERAFPELLASRDWEPHAPTLQSGVFASKFPSREANALDDRESQRVRRSGRADSRALSRRNALLRFVARRGADSSCQNGTKRRCSLRSKDLDSAPCSQPTKSRQRARCRNC